MCVCVCTRARVCVNTYVCQKTWSNIVWDLKKVSRCKIILKMFLCKQWQKIPKERVAKQHLNVSVCERERICVCACVWERVCVCACVCVCVRVWVCESLRELKSVCLRELRSVCVNLCLCVYAKKCRQETTITITNSKPKI